MGRRIASESKQTVRGGPKPAKVGLHRRLGGTMQWAELRMCRFWAGGISSFPFSRAREYRLLRRLISTFIGQNSKFFFMIVLKKDVLLLSL